MRTNHRLGELEAQPALIKLGVGLAKGDRKFLCVHFRDWPVSQDKPFKTPGRLCRQGKKEQCLPDAVRGNLNASSARSCSAVASPAYFQAVLDLPAQALMSSSPSRSRVRCRDSGRQAASAAQNPGWLLRSCTACDVALPPCTPHPNLLAQAKARHTNLLVWTITADLTNVQSG